MADRTLRTVLEAVTTNFQRGMQQAGKSADDAAKKVDQTTEAVEKLGKTEAKPQIDVDIDEAERMFRDLTEELRRLDGMESTPEVEADTQRAQGDLDEVNSLLDELRGQKAEAIVEADTAAASGDLQSVESEVRSLDGASATVRADADVSGAVSELNELPAEGAEVGDETGRNIMRTLLDGFNSIPIAGAVIGVGVAMGAALMAGIAKGLSVEQGRDLFSARTGLDEATSARFGRAAGEAYADAWGESVEANLDTARRALQAGIIDEDATQAEIEHVITMLSGITDIWEYDMPTLITGVGNLMKNDLVADADEAFDLIAAASQQVPTEDLMDTLEEYSSQWTLAGLSGEDAMGLIVQAMENGARNTDLVADAVKEMGLRVREGTDPAREALQDLGLDADAVITAFQEGGPQARDAMGEVFDALRRTRDEGGNVQEVIANLFGGPGEDLGAALFALDLDTVSEALGGVDGAAGTAEQALQTMADNSATNLESAKRNIELAVDGITGALADAFGEEIDFAADWVQRNRGPMMEFFAGIVDGAFGMAIGVLEAVGGIRQGFRDLQIEMLTGLVPVLEGLSNLPGMGDLQDLAWDLDVLRVGLQQMREEEEAGNPLFEGWEQPLIRGLEDSRDAFNDWVGPEILSAHIHDAVLESTGRLDELSAAIDNTGGTVTINGDPQNAEEAWATVVENIDESTGTVTINGDEVPAEEAFQTLLDLVNAGEGVVTIDGDPTEGGHQLSTFLGLVSASEEAVGIDAEDRGAAAELGSTILAIGAAVGTVGINAADRGARSATLGMTSWIGGQVGTVGIGGADRGARSAANAATSYADRQTGHVGIGGTVNWGSVNAALANVRSAAARASVVVGISAAGRNGGGWLGGLNAGGWVPGTNPGYDNVLWPVRLPGLAGGGQMAAQPLTGSEFVVNARDAAFWGPTLEWMNGGGRPTTQVQQVPVPTRLTVVDSDGVLQGTMRVAAHAEDRAYERVGGIW